MHLARSLAAVLAAGALALTGCAGDDLPNDDASDDSSSSGGGDKGSVTIAGQNFPEATLVASMYEQLLEDAGYTVETKLVDSRDAYMPTFPGDVDIVPEYVGGIVNFLNTQENGDSRPSRSRPVTASSSPTTAPTSSRPPGSSCSTSRRPPTPTPSSSPRSTPRPRASPRCPTSRARASCLAAAPDCEGRLDCEGGLSDDYGIDVTKVLELGYASDQTYQSVIDGESQLGETSHHRRHPGVPGPGRPRGRQGDPARAEPRAGGLRRLPRRAPGRRRHPQPADGGAHHREPHRDERPDGRRPGQARGRRQGVPGVRGPAG